MRTHTWMWRHFRSAAWLAALALSLTSCKQEAKPDPKADEKKEEPKKEEPKKEEPKANDPLSKLAKAAEDKVAKVGAMAKDNSKALTPEEQEKLLVAIAACKLGDYGVEHQCAEWKAYNEARNRNTMIKDFAGMSTKLGVKHIAHASPTVRYVAAGLMRSFFGSNNETQEVALKAIETEKEPIVLATLISVVASRAKANPKIAEMLKKMADHESDRVRREIISWYTSSFCKGLEGASDKVLEKMTKDPSPLVQRAACENAGRLLDEKFLPLYKKKTAKPDEDADTYSSCMRGLVEMWNPFLTPDGALSKGAYQLTMSRLKDKPRSKNRPPWIIMSSLGRVPKGEPAWYKQKDVIKVLKDIATDSAANWMTRTGAVRSLGELKAGDDVKAIKEKLSAKGDDWDNKHVVRACDDALAKLAK